MRLAALGGVLSLAFAATACSFNPPPYASSFQNVQQARDLGHPIKVGTFALDKPQLAKIGVRGNTLTTANGSFADYVRGAAISELTMADRYSDSASDELVATLLENDLDATGMATGHGKIAARFTLKHNGGDTFSKTISAENSWPSSFVGAVAIPNAVNAYPGLVEKMLGQLYSDTDFVRALK